VTNSGGNLRLSLLLRQKRDWLGQEEQEEEEEEEEGAEEIFILRATGQGHFFSRRTVEPLTEVRGGQTRRPSKPLFSLQTNVFVPPFPSSSSCRHIIRRRHLKKGGKEKGQG